MEDYYRERAAEYDLFYNVPEFQDDLRQLRAWLADGVRGRTVLEVAAGTGYWTSAAARIAKHITATDYNAATLAIAAKRKLGSRVTLVEADAFALPHLGRAFDAGMAHLWWSHVDKKRQQSFLSHLVSRLQPRARLLLIDQRYVRGFSIFASRRDLHGNRYERRTLANGRVHEIIKNYPTERQLRASFAPLCDDVAIVQLRYFWALRAHLR
jgi:SAM-dependent methyltransferase